LGADEGHFVINEFLRLISYGRKDYHVSYLRTKSGVEIDLIVSRPGLNRALVEIKSTTTVTERHVSSLNELKKDIPNSEAYVLSLDPHAQKIGDVRCFPWQQGLKEIGL
jgi:predicted AAA+ superfamily ATPase